MFEIRKIGIVKRASAWLLDIVLLSVLATGFMFLISLICNFDREQQLAKDYYDAWETFRTESVKDVAEFYGFTYEEGEDGSYTITTTDATGKEKPATLNDVLNKLDDSNGQDAETAEAYAKFKALPPAGKVNAQYQYVYSLLFMMISLGLLLAHLVLEFILPIVFKNGQTVGKKVFGIGLVRPDCVKITTIALFARAFLGKFAVETMFPVLLVFLFLFGGLGLLAVVLLATLLLLNIVLFFATKNRTPIHDIFAHTVAVDINIQNVFSSEEEMLEKKKEQHKQFIENSKN